MNSAALWASAGRAGVAILRGVVDGRMDAGRVIAGVPFDANGADFFFCGPANLRAAILKGLETRGITPRKTYFEMFEFR